MSTNGKGMKIRIQLVDNKLYDLSIMFVLFCLVGTMFIAQYMNILSMNDLFLSSMFIGLPRQTVFLVKKSLIRSIPVAITQLIIIRTYKTVSLYNMN